jgi:hypothetical protein
MAFCFDDSKNLIYNSDSKKEWRLCYKYRIAILRTMIVSAIRGVRCFHLTLAYFSQNLYFWKA